MNTPAPTKAKGLVEFSANKSGVLAVTDKIEAADGELTHAVGSTALEFMVEYETFWFAIHADQIGTKAVLKVHGIIGHLPFTYQSSFARTNILAVVSQACKEINAKMRVDESQRILLIDETTFSGSLTPKMIIAETAKILLKLRPYLLLVKTLQPPKQVSVKAPENYIRQDDIEPETACEDQIEEMQTEDVQPDKEAEPQTVRVKRTFTVSPGKKMEVTNNSQDG